MKIQHGSFHTTESLHPTSLIDIPAKRFCTQESLYSLQVIEDMNAKDSLQRNSINKKRAMHNKLSKSMRHKDKQLLTPYLQRNTYSVVFAFDCVRGRVKKDLLIHRNQFSKIQILKALMWCQKRSCCYIGISLSKILEADTHLAECQANKIITHVHTKASTHHAHHCTSLHIIAQCHTEKDHFF